MPVQVTETVTAHAVSFDAAAEFIRAHYASAFDSVPGSPFSASDASPSKLAYYRHAADCFELREHGRAVALFIGNAVDWSSYYFRSTAALPEYQGRGAIPRFLPFLFRELARVGVERIEADASPSNATTMQLLLRVGFKATGTTLSDRWGALVRLTKFLAPPAEQIFVDQFCAVASGNRKSKRD